MQAPPRNAPPQNNDARVGQTGWKVEHGKCRYYNAPRKALQLPSIVDIPCALRAVPNAIVTPQRRSSVDATKRISGAVYDSDGQIIEECRFSDGPDNPRSVWAENSPNVAIDRTKDMRRVEGTCLYLGGFRRHFGHFMLESLARAWGLIGLDPDVRLIYHGSEFLVPAFGMAMLRMLDVEPMRIVDYNEAIVVERLLVPSSQFHYYQRASLGMCRAFDAMRLRADRDVVTESLPKKIYLSRREHEAAIALGNGKEQARWRKTRGLNEAEVEALFVARGFTVVAPEKLPIQAQIQLLSRATHIAGLTGTALHSILFNDDPDACLIAIDGRHSVNQMLVDAVRGVNSHHIYCASERNDAGWRIDTGIVAKALEEIL